MVPFASDKDYSPQYHRERGANMMVVASIQAMLDMNCPAWSDEDLKGVSGVQGDG